jgi:hypothetical protein
MRWGFFIAYREATRMNDKLQKLRDAVVGRGREVEVTPDGQVREVQKPGAEDALSEAPKATKLAERTFGLS